jgi:hypothetical protein
MNVLFLLPSRIIFRFGSLIPLQISFPFLRIINAGMVHKLWHAWIASICSTILFPLEPLHFGTSPIEFYVICANAVRSDHWPIQTLFQLKDIQSRTSPGWMKSKASFVGLGLHSPQMLPFFLRSVWWSNITNYTVAGKLIVYTSRKPSYAPSWKRQLRP